LDFTKKRITIAQVIKCRFLFGHWLPRRNEVVETTLHAELKTPEISKKRGKKLVFSPAAAWAYAARESL
jgi:hypothetical protein